MKNNQIRIIRFIESGLKFWIKSQCESIDQINVELEGTAMKIISGEISKARIIGEGINFKGINIAKANIESGKMNLRLRLSGITPTIEFTENCYINGIISLKFKSINSLIKKGSLKWISALISEKLLGGFNFEELRFIDNKMTISSTSTKDKSLNTEEFIIYAKSGSILIKCKSNNIDLLLPMDPNITISEVKVFQDELLLSGHSTIK